MKERGIIMSGDNPRLIDEGRKTQTRRLMRPQPTREKGNYFWMHRHQAPDGTGRSDGFVWSDRVFNKFILQHCPYGAPSDRLWVREAWAIKDEASSFHASTIYYKADDDGSTPKWKPSIHMPDVLQPLHPNLRYLSEADAEAEGVTGCDWGHGMDYGGSACYRKPFEHLWDKLHGEGAWAKNPWVWCIEFKKL